MVMPIRSLSSPNSAATAWSVTMAGEVGPAEYLIRSTISGCWEVNLQRPWPMTPTFGMLPIVEMTVFTAVATSSIGVDVALSQVGEGVALDDQPAPKALPATSLSSSSRICAVKIGIAHD